jgi:hypothetical protein
LKETLALTRNKEGLILIEWVARPSHNWDNLTPGRRFSRPWQTTHLHSLLKNAQRQHAPLLEFVPGSMLPLRVGDEEPHPAAPQDGLLINLEVAPPVLKNTVFRHFSSLNKALHTVTPLRKNRVTRDTSDSRLSLNLVTFGYLRNKSKIARLCFSSQSKQHNQASFVRFVLQQPRTCPHPSCT